MAARLVLRLALLSGYSLCTSASSSSSWSSSSGSGQCTRDHTALTSDCLGLCYDGRPCIAYASTATVAGDELSAEDDGDEEEATACEPTAFSTCVNATGGGCALECFTNGPDDFVARAVVGFSSYTFLVPFTGADGTTGAKSNDTDVLPSKPNDVLKRIEPLSLLSVTTKVAIIGGASVEGGVARGKTVEMHLDDGFLASNTQLEDITLANLALRTIARGSLPTSNLTNLTLSNCLLSTTYPRDLASMASLIQLDLSQNLFTDFPSTLSLPMLEELNLSANALESFRGAFPRLVSLDLSGNLLTGIPAAVFELSRLERLDLRGNRFTSLILSETQLAFLQSLSVLSTNSLGDVSHCSPSSSYDGVDTTTSTTTSSTALQLVSVHGVDACALVAASSSLSLDGSETSVSSISESSSSSNVAVIAGSAVGGGVVLLGLVMALIVYIRRNGRHRRTKSQKLTISLDDNPLDAALYHSPRPYNGLDEDAVADVVFGARGLLQWRVDADDVHWMTEEFARGSRYVVDLAVFRHRYSHGSKCHELYQGAMAVKRLRVDDRDNERARDRFLSDVAVLSRLRHPQVTALIGVMYSRALGVQALLEFMEGGTLRSWLSGLLDAGESCAWTPIKSQLALDMAEALAYAHSLVPPLVHSRLCSDKVFLTLDARAKLSHWRVFQPSGHDEVDGMATVHLPKSGKLPERWLAPEVLTGSADYSPASDVFALGVVLSELCTHRLPYEDGGELVENGVGISVLVASGRLRPVFSTERSDGMPRELRVVAQRCLALDPRARVTSLKAVHAFRAAISSEL